MLSSLTIRDVVLIEALTIDFEAGLCVLTGETGAGKSILLDSLGLALGARGESSMVRRGAAQASVTAAFELPADHAAGRADRQVQGVARAGDQAGHARRELERHAGIRSAFGHGED